MRKLIYINSRNNMIVVDQRYYTKGGSHDFHLEAHTQFDQPVTKVIQIRPLIAKARPERREHEGK